MTLFAVSAAEAVVGDTYVKVESTADLTVGDTYILAYENNAMGAQTSKYRYSVANGITVDGDVATIASTDVCPFNLVEGTTAGSYAFEFTDPAGNFYLSCTKVDNGSIASSSDLAETCDMNISVDAGVATIVFVKNSNGGSCKLQYNTGSPRFTNYKTGTQKDCTLYKKQSGDVPVTPVDPDLAFEKEEVSVVVGGTVDAPAFTPSNLSLTYTTADASVATVDADGVVTGVAVGETTITAKSAATDRYLEGTASFKVVVTEAPVVGDGDDVTFNFSEMGYANAAEVAEVENEPVKVTFDKGSNNNTPKYYTSGTSIRMYGGNTMTVSVPDGYYISKIVFTTGTGDYAFNSESSASSGTFSVSDNTWTADEEVNSVTITQGGSKGHVRIVSMTVTYVKAGPATNVSAPKFDPEAGQVMPGTKVAISCSTEGAAIYYTLDGSEPTTASILYTEPITIDKEMTVKAIAVKAGLDNSKVVEAAYTLVTSYSSIKDILAAYADLAKGAKSEKFVVNFNMTVNDVYGLNVYVNDGDACGLVYGSISDVAQGDVIGGGWMAQLSNYNNLMEIVPENNADVKKIDGQTGVVSVPVNLTVDNVSEIMTTAYANYPVQAEKVYFDMSEMTNKKASYTAYLAVDMSGETPVFSVPFTVYNQYQIEIKPESDSEVIGFSTGLKGYISVYNDAVQFQPTTTVGDVTAIVPTTPATPVDPELTFAEEEVSVEVGKTVEAPAFTPAELSLTYTSADTSIATIDENGVITGVAAGETTITATSAATESYLAGTASFKVVVTEAPVVGGGDDVTFNFSEMGYANAAEVAEVENEPVKVTFDKGSNNNTPKYYTSGTSIRMYGGNTMTVSVPDGYYISKIVFTTGTGDYAFNSESSASSGTFSVSDNTWTADEEVNSVTITQGGSKGHVRIVSMTVTYVKAGPATNVSAPTFDPAAGQVIPGTKVAISCSTEGATIYYTLDGSEPTTASTLYTEPITIDKEMTVKAIAVKAGLDNSKVVEAVYTLVTSYSSIKDILAAYADLAKGAKSEKFVVNFNMTVNDVYGLNVYVNDGDACGLVYGSISDVAQGDVIGGGWMAQLSNYNNLMEIVPVNNSDVKANGEIGVVSEPLVLSADNVDEIMTVDYANYPVKAEKVYFNQAELTNAKASYTAYLELTIVEEKNDATGEIKNTPVYSAPFTVYNQYQIVIKPESEKEVSSFSTGLKGYISVYNDNVQFQPTATIGDVTGVESVAVDADNAAEYFNLQGVKIVSPANGGLYIVKRGNKVSKEIIR